MANDSRSGGRQLVLNRKREEEKGRVDTVMGHVDVTKLPTGQLLFTFKNLSDAQMLPMPGGTAVVGTPVSDVPDE